MPDPVPTFTGRTKSLLLALAFLGGFADTGSFVLTSSFTGHVTGNAILIMVNLARGDWTGVAVCLLAVGMFLAGTAAGGRYASGGVVDRKLRRLRRPLLIEITLFAAAVTGRAELGRAGQFVFVACLCVALGVQNGVLQRMGLLSVHTTFITGMSTALTDALVATTNAGGKKPQHNSRVLAAAITAFLAGALAAAGLTEHYGTGGFAVVFLPAAIAITLIATSPA